MSQMLEGNAQQTDNCVTIKIIMQKRIEWIAANWYVSNLIVLVSELVLFSENILFSKSGALFNLPGPGTISDSKPLVCQKTKSKEI